MQCHYSLSKKINLKKTSTKVKNSKWTLAKNGIVLHVMIIFGFNLIKSKNNKLI